MSVRSASICRTSIEEAELDPAATIRRFRIVRREGKREVARDIEHYSLDAILAVGYRVRSPRGTQFRRWATERLREYLIKEVGSGELWSVDARAEGRRRAPKEAARTVPTGDPGRRLGPSAGVGSRPQNRPAGFPQAPHPRPPASMDGFLAGRARKKPAARGGSCVETVAPMPAEHPRATSRRSARPREDAAPGSRPAPHHHDWDCTAHDGMQSITHLPLSPRNPLRPLSPPLLTECLRFAKNETHRAQNPSQALVFHPYKSFCRVTLRTPSAC
jgi:hypothetical protein